jgi:hypothetical protein
VHRAARILGNEAKETAAMVQCRFDGLLGAMARHGAGAGHLAEAVGHFLKVARSYRPGLFQCYAVPDLPRANNGLEQLFGSQRYHERRATGRRAASPAAVLRGTADRRHRHAAAPAHRRRPGPRQPGEMAQTPSAARTKAPSTHLAHPLSP